MKEGKQLTGSVFNVERFAIHDGPGIRTLIFMKGCPLRCIWCSTPQSHVPYPEIQHIETHCKKAGHCVLACPQGAITLSGSEGLKIDRKLCDSCGKCVEVCPNQALELIGREMTVDEAFREVERDAPFYRRSGGGVTVGGGEPTMQHEFVAELLKRCKQRFIHTAMETCSYTRWEIMEKLLQHLDLIYCDIKHMDDEVHRRITGVSNSLILANIKKASALRPMIVRIPTIPGLNNSEENVAATARFVAELGPNVMRLELLPYHKFGAATYRRLGKNYELEDIEPPSQDEMERLKEVVESCGIKAQIGG